MLCGSSGARISCKQDPKKADLSLVVRIRSYGVEFHKKENAVQCSGFNLYSRLMQVVKCVRFYLNHLYRGVTIGQFTDRQLMSPLIIPIEMI